MFVLLVGVFVYCDLIVGISEYEQYTMLYNYDHTKVITRSPTTTFLSWCYSNVLFTVSLHSHHNIVIRYRRNIDVRIRYMGSFPYHNHKLRNWCLGTSYGDCGLRDGCKSLFSKSYNHVYHADVVTTLFDVCLAFGCFFSYDLVVGISEYLRTLFYN